MSQFTRTNGDYLPVVNYDAGSYTNSGVNAVVTGVAVQPQGPKLDFFTVTGSGALSATQINSIFQTTQQLATVYIYQYTDDTNDSVAMAVYPTGAWTGSDLQTSIRAALTAASIANSVTVTTTATFGA